MIKNILKEQQHNDPFNDIKWAINEKLVTLEVHKDISYIDSINALQDIFPEYEFEELLEAMSDLDYGHIYYEDGDKFYEVDGYFHNFNGPSVIRDNGRIDWYIDGKEVASYYPLNGELKIFQKYDWDKYFAKNYNKEPMNENTNNKVKTDIEWLLKDNLVDYEVYPDMTYININELEEIIPGLDHFQLYKDVHSLGYGFIVYEDGNKGYYINKYEDWTIGYDMLHNINGPASIWDFGNKTWKVRGEEVAELENGRLIIINQGMWDEYFAKNYNEPLNEEVNNIPEVIINDINWVIESRVVETYKESNLTYVNINQLEGVFPDINLIDVMEYLGYGVRKEIEDEILWYDGNTEYSLHREDGPAREFLNGNIEWYIDGFRIASSFSGKLTIYHEDDWDYYFADKYGH